MDSLRERREAVVREHMESENEHDFDTTLATFDHPRYRPDVLPLFEGRPSLELVDRLLPEPA